MADANSSTFTLPTGIAKSIDDAFFILLSMIVFFMQAGFAFLEAGSVRSKNTTNILFKNLLDTCVGCIAFYAVGFAFAAGHSNAFIGGNYFFLIDYKDEDLVTWFKSFVFAATAATIVSGAVAERTELVAYMLFSILCTGFLYPVVAHWAWDSDYGWLTVGVSYNGATISYKDFAGSGVVHVVGGAAALVGAVVVGPRIGRFTESGQAMTIQGHTITMSTLGGFILFFGFFAFNVGSYSTITQAGDSAILALTATNTAIAGSAGAVVGLFVKRWLNRRERVTGRWSLSAILNGALTGLVAICAGADAVRPYGALAIGFVASFVYFVTSWIILKLRIDDPLDAVAVHFGGGLWGVFAEALLDSELGLFYCWDKRSILFVLWNVMGVIVIALWSGLLSAVFFVIMKYLGRLRVPKEMELAGLDIKHSEPGYTIEEPTVISNGHTVLQMSRLSLGKSIDDLPNVNGQTRRRVIEDKAVMAMETENAGLSSSSHPTTPAREGTDVYFV